MIAILSDVHGNLPALRAVLTEIDKLGCTRIISLGDVTGYYSQPGECLDLLIKRNALQLLGNHDKYLVDGVQCPRSRTVSELMKYQRKVISKKGTLFLSTLPSEYTEDDSSFVHGGWSDPVEQYLYHVSYEKLLGNMKFYFSGHTHVQTLLTICDKVYCNPGSVGQPRDGDSRAAFATFHCNSVATHRVKYDIDETVNAMQNAGFTNSSLWDSLYLGAQIGGRVDSIIIQ